MCTCRPLLEVRTIGVEAEAIIAGQASNIASMQDILSMVKRRFSCEGCEDWKLRQGNTLLFEQAGNMGYNLRQPKSVLGSWVPQC